MKNDPIRVSSDPYGICYILMACKVSISIFFSFLKNEVTFAKLKRHRGDRGRGGKGGGR